jgi:hypothetical protein
MIAPKMIIVEDCSTSIERKHVIDANNRDNYPLMKPLLMLEFEQKTLDATDWDEWFNCTIESPLLFSFGINASISFGEDTVHMTPELPVVGDRNNNNIPDLLLRFNRYEIVDFAMDQMAKKPNSFELFRGFALRMTLAINRVIGGIAFETRDTITVVSFVSSTPT